MHARLRTAIGVPVLTVIAATTVAMQPMSASAAPVNAPNGSTGTATCNDGHSYAFVVNGTPDNAQGTSWGPAFLTDTAHGTRALFHPESLSLTFTAPGVPSQSFGASKPKAPGPVSCNVTGHPNSFPAATFTGTVTGTITVLG